MSQVLTVPTHFNDLGELSEGFLDRVEEDTLILYGPVAYEDGSEIEFAVLLADGSPALEGVGRDAVGARPDEQLIILGNHQQAEVMHHPKGQRHSQL